MHNIKYYLATIAIFLTACHSESVELVNSCSYSATVEDHSDLDGCGYLLRLENGEYLDPVWPYFCQTPPYEVEDPMKDFEYVQGKRIRIDFEYLEGFASACMKGDAAVINCVEEMRSVSAE